MRGSCSPSRAGAPPKSQLYLGLDCLRVGRHAEAEQEYRRALASNPLFTAARFNLALALLRLGRPAEALREP